MQLGGFVPQLNFGDCKVAKPDIGPTTLRYADKIYLLSDSLISARYSVSLSDQAKRLWRGVPVLIRSIALKTPDGSL